MIKQEYPFVDGAGNERPDLIRTYSDTGHMIKQTETGELYSEAVDTYPCRYNYEETDIVLQLQNYEDDMYINSEILEKARAYDKLMGVSE